MLATSLENMTLNSEGEEGGEYEEIHVEQLGPAELVEFARYGEIQLVTELVAQGLQERLATAVDRHGNTMLHMFAANGHFPCIQAFIAHCPHLDTVISRQNAEGNTALHWACMAGQLAVAQLLIVAGAKVAVENKAERTPICEAHKHLRHDLLKYFEETLGRKEDQAATTEPAAECDGEAEK